MNLFKSKASRAREAEFLKYFKVEVTPEGTEVIADVKDEDIQRWLYAVTRSIQKSFSKWPVIKNYLEGQMIIGGQKICFAFVKDFGSTPHELRMKAERRVAELEAELARFKGGV